jgi:hypothetical protein
VAPEHGRAVVVEPHQLPAPLPPEVDIRVAPQVTVKVDEVEADFVAVAVVVEMTEAVEVVAGDGAASRIRRLKEHQTQNQASQSPANQSQQLPQARVEKVDT